MRLAMQSNLFLYKMEVAVYKYANLIFLQVLAAVYA